MPQVDPAVVACCPWVDDLGLELRDGYRWLRVAVQRQPLPNAELDSDRDMLTRSSTRTPPYFAGASNDTLGPRACRLALVVTSAARPTRPTPQDLVDVAAA